MTTWQWMHDNDTWKRGREILTYKYDMKERRRNFTLQWRHEREEEKFWLTMTTWKRGREILTNDDDIKERKRNFNLPWRHEREEEKF